MKLLLSLYAWTIPAGVFFAAALAWIGSHLAARDRAMQTVCISQGAMLGVLLALGFAQTVIHDDPDSHLLPFIFSMGTSSLTFALTQRLAARKNISKNTLFASIFAMLLAGGYLVSALFPALESHMAQIYFGDLATLTEFDSKITLGLGLLSTLGLFAYWRPISNQSFEIATFGEAFASRTKRYGSLAFNGVALAILCFSVQFLGFLFTIAALFLPTTILSYSSSKGLLRHLIACSAVAGAGAAVGFILSLSFTRLPTVPTIAMTMSLIAGALILLEQVSSRR